MTVYTDTVLNIQNMKYRLKITCDKGTFKVLKSCISNTSSVRKDISSATDNTYYAYYDRGFLLDADLHKLWLAYKKVYGTSYSDVYDKNTGYISTLRMQAYKIKNWEDLK